MTPLSIDLSFVGLGSSFVVGPGSFGAFIAAAPNDFDRDIPYLGNALSELRSGFVPGTEDYATVLALQWQLGATRFDKLDSTRLKASLLDIGGAVFQLRGYPKAIVKLRERLEKGEVKAPLFADVATLNEKTRRASAPTINLGGEFVSIPNPLESFRLSRAGMEAVKTFFNIPLNSHSMAQRFTSPQSTLHEKFVALVYWLSEQDQTIAMRMDNISQKKEVMLELAQIISRDDVSDDFRKFAADVFYLLDPSVRWPSFWEDLRDVISGLQKTADASLKQIIKTYANALYHLGLHPEEKSQAVGRLLLLSRIQFLFDIFHNKSFSEAVRLDAFYYGATLSKKLLSNGEKVVREEIKKSAMDPKNIPIVEKVVQSAVDRSPTNFNGFHYKQTDLADLAMRILRNELVPFYIQLGDADQLEGVLKLTSRSALPDFDRYYRARNIWFSPWGESKAAQFLKLDKRGDRAKLHEEALNLFRSTRVDTTVKMLALLLWHSSSDTVSEKKRQRETREVVSILLGEIIFRSAEQSDYSLFAAQILRELGPIDLERMLDTIYNLREALHSLKSVKGVAPFILEKLVQEYARRVEEYSKSLSVSQQASDGLRWFLLDEVFENPEYPLSVRMMAYQSGAHLTFVLLGNNEMANEVMRKKVWRVLEREPALVARFTKRREGEGMREVYDLNLSFPPRAKMTEQIVGERLQGDGRPAALALLEDLPRFDPKSRTGAFYIHMTLDRLPELSRGERLWYGPGAALSRLFSGGISLR